MPHPQLQAIYDRLIAYGLSQEAAAGCASDIAHTLAPDYERAEAVCRYAIRARSEQERLVYWLGRLLFSGPDEHDLRFRAGEALRNMGYPSRRLKTVLEMGEPVSELRIFGGKG